MAEGETLDLEVCRMGTSRGYCQHCILFSPTTLCICPTISLGNFKPNSKIASVHLTEMKTQGSNPAASQLMFSREELLVTRAE